MGNQAVWTSKFGWSVLRNCISSHTKENPIIFFPPNMGYEAVNVGNYWQNPNWFGSFGLVGIRKQKLTDGQMECLRLVAAHKTSKEIARILGISHFTVDQRLDAARKKLGVANRKEAALLFQSMEAGEISDRLVYEPDAIAERDSMPILTIPTSDRGHSFAGGDYSESGFEPVERLGQKTYLQQLLSIIRVPPIGGERHEHSARGIALQALNITFYAALMVGIVAIVLTRAMSALS